MTPADYPRCKACGGECHPYFAKKYHGYCLECSNAGAPEKDELIDELRKENHRLRERLAEMEAMMAGRVV